MSSDSVPFPSLLPMSAFGAKPARQTGSAAPASSSNGPSLFTATPTTSTPLPTTFNPSGMGFPRPSPKSSSGSMNGKLSGFGGSDTGSDYEQGGMAPSYNRSTWSRYWAQIWNDADSRRVFILISCLLFYMLVQFGHGVITLNIGLVSASFHTLFDCAALSTSLAAMIVSRRKPDFAFSYGYERLELMAGFTNAIFLIFVATFEIIEAFHSVYKTPDHSDVDLLLAILGLSIDAFGIFMFRSHAKLQEDYSQSVNSRMGASLTVNGGHDSNIHGVFLHVLCDLFSNMGLMISFWVMRWNPNLSFIPAVISFGVSGLILWSVRPLFVFTANVLLQTTPLYRKSGLEKAIREISTFDGVLECRSEHWWSITPGVTVGSLHIRVRAGTNEQAVLNYVHGVLKKYVLHLTVQIEKDANLSWLPT